MGSMAARVGAFTAPFIIEISPVSIPYVMYAAIGLTAAFLALLLDETSRRPIKSIIN